MEVTALQVSRRDDNPRHFASKSVGTQIRELLRATKKSPRSSRMNLMKEARVSQKIAD